MEFEQLKIYYNAQREKWGLDELISICFQEEGRMNRSMVESAHLSIAHQTKKENHNQKKFKPQKRKTVVVPRPIQLLNFLEQRYLKVSQGKFIILVL